MYGYCCSGYGYGGYGSGGYGHGRTFALIVVLFILLIIVGAAYLGC
ncbi:YjcZ family sporulation protein [Bacillus swezeyi]|uniref:Sporulation protein YjcZ n=1 Tax=Bacillus swezeyi TaxID=1925020 RepID=A0A1R1QKZ5_9BACI|nr:YjcZ family sporulation protein [Bacillus swezeyi]MEC1260698.1 YjcZ family sporulation protein [Bacillus swezeyi]MED1741649.1 YjcZ family sporulation protein [Bacillus swezeyi]MED2928634.1 YjcZ family sporulation protein [Bacillus swezeyi]MED2943212.1 YjcZ family sporulation protein [Bacillus swezeyi]MED2964156.1 YjcZ family sporulation protein [Bacillus swezeyi]